MKDDANKLVRSGDTFIAYVNDNEACVGVVTKDEGKILQVLVLGQLLNRPVSEPSIFAQSFPYPFPTYMNIQRERVVPYTFEKEIALCRARDTAWWKSLRPPCYTNLVGRYFRPEHLKELQYIAIALHILNGGTIDGFKSFGDHSDLAFMNLWAVLYTKFPNQTVKPPEERDERNSNAYLRVDLGDEKTPPKVSWHIRPVDYIKPISHAQA